ncbi:hypothetical protein EDC94DRAFT_609417 [Helicostylum pulchrum]|nr:hypothetical protein EDC94DRAFT_609417 [Helicostylum pulchrum]
MDQQKSRIITEQVFGSSRKIQFIDTSTPMNSLLSAIDHAHPTSSSERNKDNSSTHQTMSIKSLLGSNSEYNNNNNNDNDNQSQTTSIKEVSIASLLTSDNTSKRRWDDSTTTTSSGSSKSSKRSSSSNSNNNNNSNQKLIVSAAPPPNNNQINKDNSSERHKTIITCLHASVAQKSYGSEKRFLCPPPIVQIKSPSNSFITAEQRCEKLQLSMSVICENGTKILEQRSMLDENQCGSFKYLHVTGTAKAKQFNLKVDLLPNVSSTNPPSPPSTSSVDPLPLATFISKPISIISKPSKKTAKTRNISTCILANSPVSLFNRINSQTVRTKYMTSSNNMLCAKNTTWSPFDIIIVNQPKAPQPHKSHRQQMTTTVSGRFTSRIQLAHPPPPPPPAKSTSSSSSSSSSSNHTAKAPVHVTYGTEIILRDSQTGVQSPSLIIRKVDKGRIAQCAYGPVSQMQKIALQLASTIDSQPIYLSAAGSLSDNSVPGTTTTDATSSNNNTSINTWLDYSPSRLVQPEQMTLELSYEEVDDYLCWTIVGIAKFEYDYNENDLEEQMTEVAEFKDVTPPPSPTRHTTPFPILSHIEYKSDHTLNVVGQHLIQAAPAPRLLDLWLGTHALVTRISQPPQPHKPHETHWSVQLPPTQDLLVANHDLLVTQTDGTRCLELALLLVRQDGLVYHTGKALSCNLLYDSGRWSVVTASSSASL